MFMDRKNVGMWLDIYGIIMYQSRSTELGIHHIEAANASPDIIGEAYS